MYMSDDLIMLVESSDIKLRKGASAPHFQNTSFAFSFHYHREWILRIESVTSLCVNEGYFDWIAACILPIYGYRIIDELVVVEYRGLVLPKESSS